MRTQNSDASKSGRWQSDPKRKWLFIIDIIGVCNLRCPSCPVGNYSEVAQPTGTMEPSLLGAILAKATAECRVGYVCLYNWTEPLLHPRLPEMVRTVRDHDLKCGLSTNLNLMRNIDAVLAADPTDIKISLSGFSQETYGITHRRGDIETVKSNMAELARARDRTHCATRIFVNFHRYLGNHGDEARMREYAEALGFEFEPSWAYLMPLEKMLAYVEPAASGAQLTDEDRDLLGRLAFPMDEALRASRKLALRPCALRDEQMAITWQGEVMLCCTTFDPTRHRLANYLETPLSRLQSMKYEHPSCGPCMKAGLHQLFNYEVDELDDIALATVKRHHPESQIASVKVLERRRRVERLTGRAWKQVRRAGRSLIGLSR